MTGNGSSDVPSAERSSPWLSRPCPPHVRLVVQDIHFVPTRSAAGPIAVAACERQGRVLPLDVCKTCPRFVRIDVHETRCFLLCRSTDEAP